MPTMHSYWLVPAEPVAATLRAQIAELAGRYNAVEFDPHVTIYTGRSNDADVPATMRDLRASFRPLTLVPYVIGQSSRLTKTLYIRLELSDELKALSDTIRGKAQAASAYVLDDPHVSLLYQAIGEEERAKLAAQTTVPAPFTADGIVAMETEVPIDNLDQIRRWRFIDRFRYGEKRSR
jgi:hypothetical protein